MKITNNPIKKVGKFFREISAIIIGIAITLSASYWLGIRNEKKDTVLYLNALKIEIEDNIKTLEKALEKIKPSIEYSNYLQSTSRETLNNDTIKIYEGIFYRVETYSFKTTAFEMFKISGNMRLIDDKELLLSLWDVYDELSAVKDFFEWHSKIKWDYMQKDLALLIEGEDLKVAPMYNFFFLGFPHNAKDACEKALEKSNEVVEKLRIKN